MIPSFVSNITRLHETGKIRNQEIEANLINMLHKKGINVRHLGRVRYHCTNAPLRFIILNEMVARVVKVDIRGALRNELKNTGLSSVEPYKQVVLRYFNCVLNNVCFIFIVIVRMLDTGERLNIN